ncbi:helix-turn-helix domain-containing protein [Bailinhaonella thermotolerans]|uniref:XRE family transcriptional regulator n=1 Tax=Bailinhaonella thermotolerans TaxID=1070861 RepID=A0A3A4AXW9_9ACTN|nr:helix-turn-helix transcriptional regulator [Bailinhaonella thermotolerans]RJL24252.1 XRE family transcriptional regulator [Bailinhaonella thermotolerans]
MADQASPTVRRRRLAAELRRLREQAGHTVHDVANVAGLNLSASKVSRIENARTAPKLEDVEGLLRLYGVGEGEREILLRLAREAGQRGWWETYSDVLLPEYATFIGLEVEARSARNWEPVVVPGLLQTEDYARHVIRGWQSVMPFPPAQVERRIELRMKRQEVINRRDRPLVLSVVMDESTLLRRFGDASIMRKQLHHLVESAQRPNITLRILPLNGQHPFVGPAFVLFDFPVEKDHDIAYIEHLSSAIYVEQDSEVYEYSRSFERLAAESLSEEESLLVIEQRARSF